MEPSKVFRKKTISERENKITERYNSFIQLYSLDLKYMEPWSQYDNSSRVRIEESTEYKKNIVGDNKKLLDTIEIISSED